MLLCFVTTREKKNCTHSRSRLETLCLLGGRSHRRTVAFVPLGPRSGNWDDIRSSFQQLVEQLHLKRFRHITDRAPLSPCLRPSNGIAPQQVYRSSLTGIVRG